MIAARSSAHSRRRCSARARAAPPTCRGRADRTRPVGTRRQRAVVLPIPAQMVLRPTMDEHDRRTVGLAPFAHVQPQPAAPATVWIFIRRRVVAFSGADVIWGLLGLSGQPDPCVRAAGGSGIGALSAACPSDVSWVASRPYGADLMAPSILAACGSGERGFVGRTRELQQLEAALTGARRAAAPRCSSVASRASARPGWPRDRARASVAGFTVLLGHSVELVGTELPYQPFVDALGPLGGARRSVRSGTFSRRRSRSSVTTPR